MTLEYPLYPQKRTLVDGIGAAYNAPGTDYGAE